MNEPQNPNKIRRRVILVILTILLLCSGVGIHLTSDKPKSSWTEIASIDPTRVPSMGTGLYVNPAQQEFFLAGGQHFTPTSMGLRVYNEVIRFPLKEGAAKTGKILYGPTGYGFQVIPTKKGVYLTKFMQGPYAKVYSYDLWLWDGKSIAKVATDNYADVGGSHYFSHNEELYRLLPDTWTVTQFVSPRTKISLQKFDPDKGNWSDVAITGISNPLMTFNFVSGPDYLVAFQFVGTSVVLHHIDISQLPQVTVQKRKTKLTTRSYIRHVLAANESAIYFLMMNDAEGVYRLDLISGAVSRREDLDPPFHPYSSLSIYRDPRNPGVSYLYVSQKFSPTLRFTPRMPLLLEGGEFKESGELYRFEAPLD